MSLSYTIVDLPPVWPGKRMQYPKDPPFKSATAATFKALERELGTRYGLGASKITFALELKRGAMDLRADGKLKSDARPGRPVILSFRDRSGELQVYPCDTYKWWEDNLHAIAVVLEDLRRAERYGVQSTLIRAGFKQLPATAGTGMTPEEAAGVIGLHSGFGSAAILGDPASAKAAVRSAQHATHPDRHGGERGEYDRCDVARGVLSSHHGVSL
jgi:hypothetical protein